MPPVPYDRSRQDVGNVIALEHVNVTVPDMEMAVLFYVHALGLTRDPYLDLGPDLVWVNVGAEQFHIPIGDPQVVRGTVDLVLPGMEAVRDRLETLAPRFAGTSFAFDDCGDHLMVRGPWGNRFRCRGAEPGARIQLGLRSVEFPVPGGTAAGIGRFYREVIGAPAKVSDGVCTVGIGVGQSMRFAESADAIPAYDGHHVAVYVADFSRPHRWLLDRGLVEEESDEHQYRFIRIVDPDTGEALFELEHEVRSLGHPLYRRPLVNRNPLQRIPTYLPGADRYQPCPSAGPGRAADSPMAGAGY